MRKPLLATIILLIATAVGFSQQNAEVVGRITFENLPTPGARVTVRDLKNLVVRTTTSAADGTFSIESLAPGDYTIDAVATIGGVLVSLAERQELKLSTRQRVDLQLVLVKRAILKEQVTIAAGETETIASTAKTVGIIAGQEMRDRADFTLIDSLRSIPGLRVAQAGGFGRVASIKIRGLRNHDTAFLIDGIRIRDATAISGDATPFLSDITLTSVSRLEVLRGSGSSLYGTNAIGGVVDLQTPMASDGTHGQVSFAAGGLGLKRFRGNISHGFGDKFGLGGALSRTVYSEGIDGDDAAHNTNLHVRTDTAPWYRLRLSGRIFYSDADVKLNTDPDTLGTPPASNQHIVDAVRGVNFDLDQNDPDRRQNSRFFSGQISATLAINSGVAIRGYYQHLDTSRENDNGPLGVGFQNASTSVFDGGIDTANLTLGWNGSEGAGVTAGYEFERESYYNEGRTPSGAGDFFTSAGQKSHSGFAQGIVNLDDRRLRLAGGVRFQRFSLDQPDFSLSNAAYGGIMLRNPPNAYTVDGAASYYFRRSGTKFRAHIGSGYRVPSLYERFGTFFSSFPTNSFVALGDPGLEPERSIAFDAGIDQEFAGGRGVASATFFYTKLTDIIGYGNVVPPIGSTPRPFGGYVNQIGGLARGAEFSVRGRTDFGMDLSTSYTYTNSDQREPQVTGSNIIDTLGVPNQQLTLVLTQRIRRFWASFDLLATSSHLAPIFGNANFTTYVYRFSGNRRADVTVGYTFDVPGRSRQLRLFGTIENVFDHDYYENGFRTPGVNGRLGVAFSF